jgi:hypothetical protein
MKNYLRDKGYAYEYTGYSLSKLLKWKYYTLRHFLSREKSSLKNRKPEKLKKIRKLQNRMSGPAIIVGNGPSSLDLLNLDANTLQNKFTFFCVNFFLNSELAKAITPDYLVLCDGPFWNKDFVGYRNKVLEAQLEKNLVIIQPDNLETYGAETHTIYIRKNPLNGFTKSIAVDKRISGLPNYTAFYAVATAIYLGYSPIYLTGMDFNHYKFANLTPDGIILDPHHSYSESRSAWNGRDTLSRLLSCNLHQMYSLNLFSEYSVSMVGNYPPHDVLKFTHWTEIIKT